MDKYIFGTNDPEVIFDNGVGEWGSVTPRRSEAENADYFIMEVRRELIGSWLNKFFAPDAVENLEHYLENTGELLEFNEKAFMDSSYCKEIYDNEVQDAKNFCKQLKPDATYNITSAYARHGDMSNIDFISRLEPGNINIFYSLGGFAYWGKASVNVSSLEKDDVLYIMDFTFILKDRYNWNLRQGVIINDKTWSDVNFGYLNLYGMARDFDIAGVYTHKYVWRKNEIIHPDKHLYPIPLRDYW
ncbi:hypothetical protein [Citrobacter amalonaticus]|uniref:hypothetical protein n=1 Tax=Citrobacter amalonaticus TaxID=35703 RepID=UPI00300D897A